MLKKFIFLTMVFPTMELFNPSWQKKQQIQRLLSDLPEKMILAFEHVLFFCEFQDLKTLCLVCKQMSAYVRRRSANHVCLRGTLGDLKKFISVWPYLIVLQYEMLGDNITDSNLLELSSFPQVRGLMVQDQNVVDVSCLRNLSWLALIRCSRIIDVRALENVTMLNLYGCTGITDISPLRNITDLNLTGCKNVKDVSCLGGVSVLNLTGCTGVTDVSALGRVKTLNLTRCVNIIDVSFVVWRAMSEFDQLQ
eukprot:Lithocolla_globosa_v1_NODE_7751_length_904_cov_21.625442.p1 type:complete len:251 gc:universal NODE_7751_length_904_cov_21.625442:31-783(+)